MTRTRSYLFLPAVALWLALPTCGPNMVGGRAAAGEATSAPLALLPDQPDRDLSGGSIFSRVWPLLKGKPRVSKDEVDTGAAMPLEFDPGESGVANALALRRYPPRLPLPRPNPDTPRFANAPAPDRELRDPASITASVKSSAYGEAEEVALRRPEKDDVIVAKPPVEVASATDHIEADPIEPAAPVTLPVISSNPSTWSHAEAAASPIRDPFTPQVALLGQGGNDSGTWRDPFWLGSPDAHQTGFGDAPVMTGSVPSSAAGNLDESAEEAARRPELGMADVDPRQLVYSLQKLQDQIAQGSTEAFAAQRVLLEQIETAFAAAPAELWNLESNAAALVTYVLSGGKPTVLRQVLGRQPLPPLDERLMRGALAYVEGQSREAKEALSKIDAQLFPASMGAQVAIAQAALIVADDPQAAAKLLDTARLLAPGTLAEEAALRREILVVARLQDVEKFRFLSRQYLERFRRSVYAANFRQRFAAALARMSFLDDPAQFDRLEDILSGLEPEARLELQLVIARAAVVQAKAPTAVLMANDILEKQGSSGAARARALLYRAATSAVLADGINQARTDLAAIDIEFLDQTDRELMKAAAETIEFVHTAAERRELVRKPLSNSEQPEKSPVVLRAQEAIAGADTLLDATL